MSDELMAKQSVEDNILNKNNIAGIGVGEKWVDGLPTDTKAILIFVEKKITESDVIGKYSVDDVIPKEIAGIPTDVIEVGKIAKQNLKNRVRPIKPGYSCGHRDITAGTIGGFFLDRDNDPVILSNNHVLANEGKAKIGDPIYQPGPLDASGDLNFREWPDPVSLLPYFATLKKFNDIKATDNTHDSAIAKIHPKFISSGMIDTIYPVVNRRFAGFASALVGMQVQKCGRTTGYTTGRVIALHASFTVGYDFGNARFNDCVVLSAMSQGGDSGSIIYNMDMQAVAHLFAGSKQVTIANPIHYAVEYYCLKPWSNAFNSIELDDGQWTVSTVNGKIITGTDSISVNAPSNAYCFVQRRIRKFDTITVTANTGTDKGTIFGPSLSVIWPNGVLKVSLRYNGSFTGSLNNKDLLGIGKVKENTEYTMRIRKTANTYVGEVKNDQQWITVIEVPTTVFAAEPLYLTIGKTNRNGFIGNGPLLGTTGQCRFRDLDVK